MISVAYSTTLTLLQLMGSPPDLEESYDELLWDEEGGNLFGRNCGYGYRCVCVCVCVCVYVYIEVEEDNKGNIERGQERRIQRGGRDKTSNTKGGEKKLMREQGQTNGENTTRGQGEREREREREREKEKDGQAHRGRYT